MTLRRSAQGAHAIAAFGSLRAALSLLEKGVLLLILACPLLVYLPLLTLQGFLAVYALLNALLVILWLSRTGFRFGRGSIDSLWDASLVLCGLWMALATLVNSLRAPEAFPRIVPFLLLAWESGIVLAIYARRNYSTFFDYRLVFGFAIAVLVSQVGVCLAQFYVFAAAEPPSSPLLPFLAVNTLTQIGGDGIRMSRAVGTLAGGHMLGAWIALMLPFPLYAVSKARAAGRSRAGLAYLCLVLVCLTILVRNVARLSMLAGAAVVVLMLWTEAVRPSRNTTGSGHVPRMRSGPVFCALLLAAAVGYLTLGGNGVSGFWRVLQARIADSGDTTRVRIGLMKAAVAGVPEHPWFGVGHANSPDAMPEMRTITEKVSAETAQRYSNVKTERWESHNPYLTMALEGGLPALVPFLVALLWTLNGALRRFPYPTREEASFAAAVLAFLVINVAHNQVWHPFMFLLGALKACGEVPPAHSRLPRP